jgi:hypothetical protein
MALPSSSPYFSRFGQCEFLDIDEDELDTSSLRARIIKSSTQDTLLNRQSWPTPTSDTNIDAATLLSDLSRLAPSVAREFISKDHVNSAFTFRLINEVNFQGVEGGYIAMSYCRKRITQTTPRRVVTPIGDLPFGWQNEVEQFPLPTSAALFQAVVRERDIGEGLWFDQVCIKQDDEVERAITIGAMDTIYKNARTVVVALDDVFVTPDEENFLRYYVEQYNYSELPDGQQPNTGLTPPFMQQCDLFRSFLERIVGSDWFERAWCALEMNMGRSHVFLVPCYKHYESEVQTILRFTGAFFTHTLVLASEHATFTPAFQSKVQSLLDVFQHRKEDRSFVIHRSDTLQDPITTATPFIPSVAGTFRMKAGGNPRLPEYLQRLDANRNKTCIALNTSGLPLALAPSGPFSRPNIEDECLRSLLLVGIAARDPVALCTMGTPLQLHDGSVSWLCRPTSLDVNGSRSPPPRFNRQANQIVQATDGRAEYAQLDLVFLDLPHRTQPSSSFSTHIARARMLIDLCVQYQIPGCGIWSFSRAPDHPRSPALRNIFIQTLACVFDCGPQWLAEVSRGLQPMDPQAIDMLMDPNLILQNYILLKEGQAVFTQFITFLSTLIASGIPWPSGALECTHGPLIISATTSSATYVSSTHRLPTHTGKAIMFAPFGHSRTLLVAVPAAVQNTAYASLARGWILTSMNPYTGSAKGTVSWTLQSKGVMFGDMAFNGGLEDVGQGESRKHRVYGPSRR